MAIVTGGGSGLGREITGGLARAGFAVVVADVDLAAAEESARAAGRGSVAMRADIREPEQARGVVDAAVARGGPHVLVNNAGGWTAGGQQYPWAAPDDWIASIALNLTAPMLLTQLVLEPMRRLGGGAIVTIGSSAGSGEAAYGSPEYAAAKAGLVRLTTSLSGLDAEHGVRVMCAVPDWIGLERAQTQLAARTPADRAATPPLIPPADVVAVVLDLISTGRGGTVVELWGGQEPITRHPG
ncbi:hypothetical protein ADL15_20695 [Actinoplanes awajinensis subsp. mycoplanecinus]|uniref:3-oxoacyl-ACP reductase n=1 Tax=Actinoplanes awajinensis subsp. mycoplanecinus TaxID=135947 RepID=A0A124GAD9_9ACTN|nr:hypothetical protein ADL15_20695 [Actinoplanes awajinensis subsp. mycoplanecinus]